MLTYARLGLNTIPRLREFLREVEAEVVSKSRNKIHQTWIPPFSRALYCWIEVVPERETCPVTINHDCAQSYAEWNF